MGREKAQWLWMEDPHKSYAGTNHHNAKLTPHKVRRIRKLFAGGMKRKDVAEKFGIHEKNVVAIVHKRTWRHVV